MSKQMTPEEIGAKIKARRKEEGYTIAALAREIDYSDTAVAGIEKGTYKLQGPAKRKIEAVLNFKIDEEGAEYWKSI